MEEFNSYLEAERDLKVLQSELNGYNREFNDQKEVKRLKFELKRLRDLHIERTNKLREKVKTAKETVGLRKEILKAAMIAGGRQELTDNHTGIIVKLVHDVKKSRKEKTYRKHLY